MPTDNEIARFLTERVLGWRLAPEPGDDGYYGEIPDFLSWDGFGLLLEALVHDWTLSYHQFDDDVAVVVVGAASAIENSLPRALMMAAFKAYGGVL